MLFALARIALVFYFVAIISGGMIGVSTLQDVWQQGLAMNAETQSILAEMQADALGFAAIEPAADGKTATE